MTKRLEHLPIPEQLTLELILQDPRYPWIKAVMDWNGEQYKRQNALLAKVGLKFHLTSSIVVADYAKLVAAVQEYGARDRGGEVPVDCE
jgi:hypothetical protein